MVSPADYAGDQKIASERDPCIVYALTTLAGVLSPLARAVRREFGEHNRVTYLARSPLFLVVSSVQVPAKVQALGRKSKGRLVYCEYPMNIRIGHSNGK